MPKPSISEAGNTAIRLIKMLSLIPQNNVGVTTHYLRDRLEHLGYFLDVRSIQRDLQNLSVEFPLAVRTEGRTNYWFFKHGTQCHWPAMNPDTALSVMMAEQNLQSLIPEAAHRGFQPILNQAKQTLTLQDRNGYSRWLKAVRLAPKGVIAKPSAINPDVMNAIYAAISKQRQLKIIRNSKESIVNPLGVVLRGHTLYLVCNFADYSDIRIIAMHRIQSAENLMSDCKTPPHFDLDTTLNSGIMSWRLDPGKPKQFELEVTASAKDYFEENTVNQTQTIKTKTKNSFVVSFTVEDTLELRQWLLGFGGEVTVTKPVAVKKWLVKIAKEISENYEK